MSIFDTFKRGLQKTATALSRSVSGIFTEVKKWDDETFKKLENELISADFGVSATKKIMADIRDRYQRGILNGSDDILNVAKEDMIAMLTPGARKLRTAPDGSLTVILMVGVNGSGKTTTAGKLAYLLTNQGRKVTLAACDT
ncbi:MAG: signal recognition particle receptor subunit alpha, partial [Victivallales bacterium]